MADKLDWLGKHFVLIRYLTVEDAVNKEKYKIAPDVADLFEGLTNAEDMIFKFAKLGRYKHACELMGYIAHRRAAVWWGYRCVLSLWEELALKPAETFELGATPKAPKTAFDDLPKVEAPKPDPAMLAQLNGEIGKMEAETARLEGAVNPAMRKYVSDGVAKAFDQFKEINGVHPMELLKTMGERMKTDPYRIDPNSPILKAAESLKAQVAAEKAKFAAQFTSQMPGGMPGFIKGSKKSEEHQKKLSDNAMTAVYRWVAAPTAENAAACVNIANETGGTPEGLLAACAFWAFGNLLPGGDQVIPTPPGLFANGFDKVFLMCALAQGGTREMEERYELYFNLGVNVLIGADNWENNLSAGTMPHQQISPAKPGAGTAGKAAPGTPEPPPQTPPPAYKRWKPDNS
jgi:hypothetical protein